MCVSLHPKKVRQSIYEITSRFFIKPRLKSSPSSTSSTGIVKFTRGFIFTPRANPKDRVFKIHKKNLHEIGKVLVCLKQSIFNIKSSKIIV